ncbi:MAG: hypothetical protein CMJ89_11105 [Planctomycetes bacterium]|nr:hypothetical protein [Planctomycetota bacterium]
MRNSEFSSAFRSLPLALLLLVAVGCGGGAVGFSDNQGQVATDGDRLFITDAHQNGAAQELRLVEMFWGRLVNVHDVDPVTGSANVRPLLRDLVINENLSSDGIDYTIDSNPVTQATRLIIHRSYGSSEPEASEFIQLLKRAGNGLAPVVPRNDNGTSSPPFSYVARNACLVGRFDDLLDDSEEALVQLSQMVRVVTGYPPAIPFQGRLLFDPNHGALLGGHFHSTRVLIDLSISRAEAESMPGQVQANSFGLPSSQLNSPLPNVSLRLPTRTNPGQGQFRVLSTVGGASLSSSNGPMDPFSPTLDLVRAFRAGNDNDINSGFVLDFGSPQLVGAWSLDLTGTRPRPGGAAGFEFVADLTYLSPCQKAPRRGEILTIGPHFLQVSENAVTPNDGVVSNLSLEVLSDQAVPNENFLNGRGFLRPVYDVNLNVTPGCWLSFLPEPGLPPDREISPNMQAIVRFSEAMAPGSVIPMESFNLIRGFGGMTPTPASIVIGSVATSDDLQEFRFTPSLPLSHQQQNENYHFLLENLTDLAGNSLLGAPDFLPFTVDPEEPPHDNGGITLRFNDPNEVDPTDSGPDLRGQFFFDLNRGVILPRPVGFASAQADRSNPVPSIMVPFAPGVQTPMAPLGSRLQKVWRYVDFGWQVLDETRFNLDVVGLSWSPIGGLLLADVYENFELLLAHSRRLPDECVTVNLLPAVGGSGLLDNLFSNNILTGDRTEQKIVHDRSLGYVVDPSHLFLAPTGTVMMPYPLNRGNGPLVTYTWRDTRSLSTAGPSGRGLPLCIEIGAPLFLEDGPQSRIRGSNNVPTFGLPLLIEVKTFPSSSGIGLNALDISLAINSSRRPNFRVFSTGGINRFGVAIETQPDLEPQPRGGFNPNSTPPGRRTPAGDNSFYVGQMDYVTRVSLVHSIWLPGRPSGPGGLSQVPDYFEPVIIPTASEQPAGTEVILEYRGAVGFLDVEDSVFDSSQLDSYGNPFEIQTEADGCNGCVRPKGTVFYLDDVRTWTEDIDLLDTANFLQLRITFINNIESGESPEIDAIGIPIDY